MLTRKFVKGLFMPSPQGSVRFFLKWVASSPQNARQRNKKRSVRQAPPGLPLGDRFIRHPQFFRQLGLGQALFPAAGSHKKTDLLLVQSDPLPSHHVEIKYTRF